MTEGWFVQTPEAIVRGYVSQLDQYQNKLLLKDNGENTVEISTMIRFLERIRLAMLDAQTPREAIEHYHSMRHEKVAQRMKRYGLEM